MSDDSNRTLPAAQPTGMEDSRAEFEKWFVLRKHRGSEHDNDADMGMLAAWQAARQSAAVPEALSNLQHSLQFARQDAANFRLMTEELLKLASWLGASTPKGHDEKVRILAKAKSLLGGVTIKGDFPKVGE